MHTKSKKPEVWKELDIIIPDEKCEDPVNDLIVVTIQKGHGSYSIPEDRFLDVIDDFHELMTIYHPTWQVKKSQKYVAVFPIIEYQLLMEQIQKLADSHILSHFRMTLFIPYHDIEAIVLFHSIKSATPEFSIRKFGACLLSPRVLRLLAKVPKTHPTLKRFRQRILPIV